MEHASRLPTPSSKEPTDRSSWRFEPIHIPTEWIESYRPGGFHPIHPGDLLGDDQYSVVCKLGHGSFSTVWLAQDNLRSKLVAIKVARADARQVLEELRLHRVLAESTCQSKSAKHVLMPINDFRQIGPNGEHQCLVFEPMGPTAGHVLEGITPAFSDTHSLEDTDSLSDGPPPPPSLPSPPPPEEPPSPPPPGSPSGSSLTLDQRKKLLKQLLLGLHHLHSSRIAHGDINPGNLLLCVESFSTEDVENNTRSSKSGGRSAPVRRIDGEQDAWAPRYLCNEVLLTNWVELKQGLLAEVSDLGGAFTFDDPPSADQCATPAALRAPEIVLKNPIDEKIDIWSFGCLVYEFLTERLLFQVSGLAGTIQERTDDDHLLQMVDTLGRFPPKIFTRWPRRARYFIESLQLVRSDVGQSEVADGELFRGPSLEEAFGDSMPERLGVEEATSVLRLLRRILQYDPSLRPSTSELLEDPWLQSID